MTDAVAYREHLIDRTMYRDRLTREEATARVDAEIAQEEANARAYVYLLDRVRELRVAAA